MSAPRGEGGAESEVTPVGSSHVERQKQVEGQRRAKTHRYQKAHPAELQADDHYNQEGAQPPRANHYLRRVLRRGVVIGALPQILPRVIGVR